MSTATADPQARELMIAILSWVAKWESQRKSERLRAKVQTKRAHAQAVGQRALCGRGKLATDEDAARVMALKAEGKSVRAIAATVGLSRSVVGRLIKRPTAA